MPIKQCRADMQASLYLALSLSLSQNTNVAVLNAANAEIIYLIANLVEIGVWLLMDLSVVLRAVWT